MTIPETSCEDPVLRRILVKSNYYNTETKKVHYNAFRPISYDVGGLSLSRGNCTANPDFLSIQEFGEKGSNQAGYYVAELSKKDIEELAHLVPDPKLDDPGHCLLPGLTYRNRKSDESLELMRALANLTLQVHGPFYPSADH